MHTLFLFLLSSIVLTLSPGPDMLLVITLGLQYSFRQVLLFILGLCTGLFIHTLLLTIGWQQFLADYPQAIQGFKLVGAFYFAYLAWSVFRAKKQSEGTTLLPFKDGFALWKKGILMNVLNPKVGLFFWFFFPGFLFSKDWPLAEQYLILGVVFVCQAFLVMASMGYMASKLKDSWSLAGVLSGAFFRYFTATVLAILALYIGVS